MNPSSHANLYDFIVIGAGMAGVSVAARLAPSARVAVLEMESQAGYHSTGRSAASWIENYGNDTVVKLNRASYGFLDAPTVEEIEGSLLTRRGVLWSTLPDDAGQLDASLSDDVVEIAAKDAWERVPALKRIDGCRYALEAEAYDIDVDRLHGGLMRSMKRAGSELHLNSGVTAMTWRDGLWHVAAGADEFAAPVVVNAAGAWGDSVAALAGIEPLGLTPTRRSAALIEVPDPWDPTDWPMVLDINESFYFRPDSGRLMLSPADETPVEPHDAWADDLKIAEAADVFGRVMQFEVTRVTHTWGGLRTFTPSRTPVAGMDDHPGFFWLVGQGGYGIQTSPAMSLAAASVLLESPWPDELSAEGLTLHELAPRQAT